MIEKQPTSFPSVIIKEGMYHPRRRQMEVMGKGQSKATISRLSKEEEDKGD